MKMYDKHVMVNVLSTIYEAFFCVGKLQLIFIVHVNS